MVITRNWLYQDRNGILTDYYKCIIEANDWIIKHKEYYK